MALFTFLLMFFLSIGMIHGNMSGDFPEVSGVTTVVDM